MVADEGIEYSPNKLYLQYLLVFTQHYTIFLVPVVSWYHQHSGLLHLLGDHSADKSCATAGVGKVNEMTHFLNISNFVTTKMIYKFNSSSS